MAKASDKFRVEHDTMGEVLVPKDALYRAQTQRAVENFPISGTRLEADHIVALAQVKRAAALANEELGILDSPIARAIVSAADKIIAGEHLDQFPVDTYQTGSGHIVEHEHERSVGYYRHRHRRGGHPPQRPRELFTIIQRRVPHLRPRRRDKRFSESAHSRSHLPRR